MSYENTGTLKAPALRRAPLLRPLASRDFALLWTGMTVSLLGDGIYSVAIAWQVYELSNAPTRAVHRGRRVDAAAGAVPAPDRRHQRPFRPSPRDHPRGRPARRRPSSSSASLAVSGTLEALAPARARRVLRRRRGPSSGRRSGRSSPTSSRKGLLVEANSLESSDRTATSRLAGPALGGLAIAALGTGGAFLLDATILRVVRRSPCWP